MFAHLVNVYNRGMKNTGHHITEILADRARTAANGPWYPACGGTEVPFYARSGARLLYCYQPSTGSHAYLNMDTDIFLTDEEATAHLGVS